MKIFIISDIHGSVEWLKKALKIYEAGDYDQIALLGDVMYHGPRNPLPDGYNPKKVSYLLNGYKDKIIAVRGNCDSEVDQMLLEFSIMSDYSTILLKGRRVFMTHGHIFNEMNMPPLQDGDIFLQGHTHIPSAKKNKGIYICNPGSISLPKMHNPNSYGVLTNRVFQVIDFDGNILEEIKFTAD